MDYLCEIRMTALKLAIESLDDSHPSNERILARAKLFERYIESGKR